MAIAQQRASDPTTSVWVSASAGTGKTKVLVDRLIAILYQGTPISHIVCLTFTKAAAIEMRERLLKRLQEDTLKEHHRQTGGKASIIYESLLESPETLKIMTLHGYCQSLLQKFPFEAGVPPFFDVLDDDTAQQLLIQAMNHVLTSPPTDAVAQAIEGVSNWMGEYTFEKCLRDAFSRWHKIRHLERIYPTAELFEHAIIHGFDADIEETQMPDMDSNSLVELLMSSGQTMDLTLGSMIASQGLTPILFLTKEGKLRKKIVSADFKKKNPQIALTIDALAHHIYQTQIKESYEDWLAANRNFWHIVQAVLAHFGTLKTEQGALDYHDLILHSLALFSDDLALSFVHQRLDYTIDHILIDEAQDNSPEQWLFILKLVDLFVREDTRNRSLFVVGDVKQSIYSFQGAVPDLFESLAGTFEHLLQSRGHRFTRLNLDDSFRTVQEILDSVDAIFANNPMGMGSHTKHKAYRSDRGWVGLTFLSKDDLTASAIVDQADEVDEKVSMPYTNWPIFDRYETIVTKDATLANHIADGIQQTIKDGWILPSVERAIEPQDILILVRNRGTIAGDIIRALKQRNIAVEGPDRLNLSSRLAIQDVIAALRFLCLPHDDMALAHLLKSPFINDGYGFDEEVLFALCHNREGSLWHVLCDSDEHLETTSLLKSWLSRVDYDTPSFLLRMILNPTYSAFENRLGTDIYLLFETLLDTVINLETQYPTLAEVLFQLEQSMPVVKRDATTPTGVRIMTIHGAKGLEAPLVIMVDRDERLDLTKENLLWPKINDPISGEIVELFCLKPKSTLAIESIKNLRENALNAMREEHNRLLYVALTRPRDGLWVIGGGAWAEMIKPYLDQKEQTAFARLATTPLSYGDTSAAHVLPDWIHKKYESNNTGLKIPSASTQTEAMKRGEIIHRLIETLTKIPDDRWNIVMNRFKDEGLSDIDLQKIHDLTHHPDFCFLFNKATARGEPAHNTRAWSEIEIFYDGKLHRIDRLVETDDTFLIIDFKTGKRQRVQAYHDQLANYKTAISSMTGNKPIRALLLWTDALELEEV